MHLFVLSYIIPRWPQVAGLQTYAYRSTPYSYHAVLDVPTAWARRRGPCCGPIGVLEGGVTLNVTPALVFHDLAFMVTVYCPHGLGYSIWALCEGDSLAAVWFPEKHVEFRT